MRVLTRSGSARTSTPPTIAVPEVGSSSPQSMRIVVDFPAPLLPRKPKISPRRTSKLTLSTATNCPNRRERPRTSMALSADASAKAELLSDGALQPGLRQPHIGRGARAVQFRLETRDLRVQHVGRRGHAG